MSPFHVIVFHFPTTASVTRQVLTLSLLNLLFSKFVNNLLIPSSRGAFSMRTSPSSLKHLTLFLWTSLSLHFWTISQWLSVSHRDSQWLLHASFVARQPREQGFRHHWYLELDDFSPGGAVLCLIGVQQHPWPLPDRGQQNPYPTIKNVSRHCSMSPGGQNHLPCLHPHKPSL